MSWRQVLNAQVGSRIARDGILSLARTARDLGYKFLAWNGTIYFVSSDANTHDTGLTVADIDNKEA